MNEHSLLTFISVLTTVAVGLLTILVTALRSWKKAIMEQVREVCAMNQREHEEIWERVNHHLHNGDGNVVIPTISRLNRS